MITVVNKKKHVPTPDDVYIGRGSALGNPYTSLPADRKTKAEFRCSSREESLQKFTEYLNKKIEERDKIVCDELNRIWKLSNKGNVNLVCYCVPSPCHGNIIKNIIDKKKKSMIEIKKAAQVVLINEEGLVLGVSRKTDHNDFGLPGGKVDPEDKDEMAAAIREVKEETGLDITDLQLVFVMHRNGYLGYTYIAKYSGEINHNEPHVVKWVPFEVIMNGTFGRFNQLVAESLENMGVVFKK